jgi:hypothetical protein
VLEYFKTHFQNVFRRATPPDSARHMYTHCTAVIDIEQTQAVIHDVRDSIFRASLAQSGMV